MPGLPRHAPDLTDEAKPQTTQPIGANGGGIRRMPPLQIAAFQLNTDVGKGLGPNRGIAHCNFIDSSGDSNHDDLNKHGHAYLPSHGTHGSTDSEHDLAAMVHDFIENGSYGSDLVESSDGESGLPNGPRIFETLQALKFNSTALERELLLVLNKLSLAIKEIDVVCPKPGVECRGACIRRLLVKHLRLSSYDAAVCCVKWLNSDKVPGGEYEYIDVVFDDANGASDRLIVDIDFQSQFEIARPTHSYMVALKLLPVIFVGSVDKLRQVLQVMADAAKLSLKQNAMPLPPWRTLDYMTVKWLSSFERSVVDTQSGICRGPGKSNWRERRPRSKQCVEQLRHLKLCVAAESDKGQLSKANAGDKSKVIYPTKSRRGMTGLPYIEKNTLLKAAVLGKPDLFLN